jgi:hypothetical protein
LSIPRAVIIVITANLLQACELNTSGLTAGAPEAATLQLGFSQVKQFDFTWTAVPWAESYQLLERSAKDGSYEPIGEPTAGESSSLTMPLHLRFGASYLLRACGGGQCVDSEPVDVADSMAAAVGYLKAPVPGSGALFGSEVALSDDGDTLAVAAYQEGGSGAVYVFVHSSTEWVLQEPLKPPDAEMGDAFGNSLAMSSDGNTLAVGANGDDGFTGAVYVFVRTNGVWTPQPPLKASDAAPATAFGVGVAMSDDGKTLAVGADGKDSFAGAVYVFTRMGSGWSETQLKASDTGAGDTFGNSVALSDDGNTLAVGAPAKDSGSTSNVGAAYVFIRSDSKWSQDADLKASNAGAQDFFGNSVAMSGDGNTVTVGAYKEKSAATGIDGNGADDSAPDAGAVYVFARSDQSDPNWPQQAYLKASNAHKGGSFGSRVALSDDGSILAVGANGEGSAATGIGGDQTPDLAPGAGAAYVFERSNSTWSQRTYVKASNTSAGAQFGRGVAVSADGKTLTVGAIGENGGALGAGAVYVY